MIHHVSSNMTHRLSRHFLERKGTRLESQSKKKMEGMMSSTGKEANRRDNIEVYIRQLSSSQKSGGPLVWDWNLQVIRITGLSALPSAIL